MKNNRAQSLLATLIVFGMGLIIFVFALPIIISANGLSITSGPIGFVVNIFPWVILLIIIGRIYRAITGGGTII